MTREELLQNKPLIIAGPCSVSSREQILGITENIVRLGVHVLRAQLWKPRTKPDSFQGIGEKGLPWIAEAKSKYKIPVVMEVTSQEQVELVSDTADVLWIGARNMQNYELLKYVQKQSQPVILKRGLVATVEEWLGAANYCGIDKTILCERGVRTGTDSMRFTLDINSALIAKRDYGMPVLIDPSHTAGRRDMVPALANAAIASGIDGLIIEAHTNPEEELVDKAQTVTMQTLGTMIESAKGISKLVNLR